MSAVMGVVVHGCTKTGALCASHAAALRGRDGVTLFRIPRNRRTCNVCSELQRGATHGKA